MWIFWQLLLPMPIGGLFDLVTMQEEFRAMVGREVDLVERGAVEKSENYIRRRHILESAEPIYVAG